MDFLSIGNTLSEDVEVAVCTIEKANIIVNLLLDENRKHQLLMVVVDEIHLIGDSGRGFLLEVLLSKVKYAAPRNMVFSDIIANCRLDLPLIRQFK